MSYAHNDNRCCLVAQIHLSQKHLRTRVSLNTNFRFRVFLIEIIVEVLDISSSVVNILIFLVTIRVLRACI